MAIELPNSGSSLIHPRDAERRAERRGLALPRFDIGRMNDNELILFAEKERESWIIYPPRSQYEHLRRPTPDSTIVEHRSWQPFSEAVEHVLRPADGCAEHGIDCGALTAVEAAAQMGWNAFR